MSGPDTGQSPRGGLTKGQDFAAPSISLALWGLLIYVSVTLFPDLPIYYPFVGAAIAMSGFTSPSRRRHGPTGWPSVIKFIAAITVAAWAAGLGVAALLAAAGWTGLMLEIIIGFGAAFLTARLITKWIVRLMIQRRDNALEDQERQA